MAKAAGTNMAKGLFDEIPYFPYIMTGIFLILTGVGMGNHEMWRDEHQAWLVARDAGSFSELYQNMRYEGNPMLWHSFLWILTQFTWDPVAMQIFHWLIAGSFIYVLHKFSPLSRTINVLLTFNYFFFYEYAVISRGYGLGLLLALLACAFFRSAGRKPLLMGGLLFFLANTSIYGALMASAIFGILFIEKFFGKQKQVEASAGSVFTIGICWITGFILCVWQVMPEADNSFPVAYASGAFDTSRWWTCAWKIFTAWFSMPDMSRLEFWNTSFFIPDDQASFALFPVLIITAFSMMFLKVRSVFLVFVLGMIGMTALFYYTLLLHGRYLGHFLVLLVICLWLLSYFKEENARSMFSGWGEKIRKFLLPAALGVSAVGGVMAFMKDMNVPFSGSVEAVQFLNEKGLSEMKIVGATDFVVSCIPSELGNRNTYYPERGEWGTFVIWDKKREATVDFNKVVAAAAAEIKKSDSVLVILTAPPNVNGPEGSHLLQNMVLSPDVEVRVLKMVTKTVVRDEQYYIYMAKKPGKF